MEFRVLGPLEVSVGGVPVPVTAGRQRALLAALLVRAGQVVSSETLIESLWGGDPPSSAANLLRLYVSQVRRALAAGRLVTRRPGYVLVVNAGELDADRFQALLAEGRRAAAEGNSRLAASLHRRALAEWRGPALADLAGEAFAREEAGRLDELRLQCLEERVGADLELGAHREVLGELEVLVAQHPFRDRPLELLMLALYRAGRQAEALACYRRARETLVAELGLEPGPELRELERLILRHDPSLTLAPANGGGEPRRHRVSPPPTITVGRDRELAEIRRLLLSPAPRLVTLVGPGGIGKTRLAVQTAELVGEELADGAVLVELEALRDPDLLLSAIGHALGLRETGGSPWPELLGEHLRPLELLLVLDNLEHLLAGVAPLVRLLSAAPRIRILATSTTVMRLSAEQVFVVAPLERPAAFELFMRQTLASGAAVELVTESRDTLSEVCDRLEGWPLAIELAAPWLRTLPPATLLDLLDSRLDTLHGGARDAPVRHRALRSTIDWSFDLLTGEAQRLFAALSVFAGGFTVESMAGVAGPQATAELLDALVAASMVHARDGRYHLLDVVREYAAERLGEEAGPRRAHAAHFALLAADAEGHLSGDDQVAWLERLDAENDNLRSALDWLACEDASAELELAARLGRFWYVRGHIAEGLTRLTGAIDRAPEGDPALAGALRGASALAVIKGDYPLAHRLAARSLAVYRELGDRVGAARCLSNLGAILHAQGELDLAAATLDECVRECAALGEERLLALAQNNRGDVALSQRDLDSAREHFEQSLAVLRRLRDSANVARSMYNLGAVAVEQDRLAEARAMLGESIALSERVGDHEDVAWCLIALAAVAARTAAPSEGARMLGFADALLERIGATMKPFEQDLYGRTRDVLREDLGPAAFARALADGAALRLADAIGLACEPGRAEPVPRPRRAKAAARRE